MTKSEVLQNLEETDVNKSYSHVTSNRLRGDQMVREEHKERWFMSWVLKDK